MSVTLFDPRIVDYNRGTVVDQPDIDEKKANETLCEWVRGAVDSKNATVFVARSLSKTATPILASKEKNHRSLPLPKSDLPKSINHVKNIFNSHRLLDERTIQYILEKGCFNGYSFLGARKLQELGGNNDNNDIILNVTRDKCTYLVNGEAEVTCIEESRLKIEKLNSEGEKERESSFLIKVESTIANKNGEITHTCKKITVDVDNEGKDLFHSVFPNAKLQNSFTQKLWRFLTKLYQKIANAFNYLNPINCICSKVQLGVAT